MNLDIDTTLFKAQINARICFCNQHDSQGDCFSSVQLLPAEYISYWVPIKGGMSKQMPIFPSRLGKKCYYHGKKERGSGLLPVPGKQVDRI